MALMDHVSPSSPSRATPRRWRSFSILSLLSLLRTRRALRKLDTRLLKDIGVTSEAAAREARKPVWDVPRTWKNR